MGEPFHISGSQKGPCFHQPIQDSFRENIVHLDMQGLTSEHRSHELDRTENRDHLLFEYHTMMIGSCVHNRKPVMASELAAPDFKLNSQDAPLASPLLNFQRASPLLSNQASKNLPFLYKETRTEKHVPQCSLQYYLQ